MYVDNVKMYTVHELCCQKWYELYGKSIYKIRSIYWLSEFIVAYKRGDDVHSSVLMTL